jgi:hypothetical protein
MLLDVVRCCSMLLDAARCCSMLLGRSILFDVVAAVRTCAPPSAE